MTKKRNSTAALKYPTRERWGWRRKLNYFLFEAPSGRAGSLTLLLGQLIFYGVAFWGWEHQSRASKVFVKIPMYFIIVNASIFVAWWRYLKGQRLVMWTPSER